MNMQSINLLILLDITKASNPLPPNKEYWVDNNMNYIIANTGEKIVFNVP